MNKRTIAICGFSQDTLPYITESTAEEVWTLNNAYKYDDIPMERVTRWYELHAPWQLFSDDLESYHRDWLEQAHPFPIYMQAQYPQFPSAVEYPLSQIALWLDGGRKYLTNSIAFMLAQAIYEKVDRIELYGVDMRHGTEYAYQKAGTEYLIGLAIGRGIEVHLPPGCGLLNAPLYAYDADAQMLNKDVLSRHRDYYQRRLDVMSAEYLPLANRYKGGEAELLDTIRSWNAKLWLWDGAQAAMSAALDSIVINDRVSRQTIERRVIEKQNQFDTAKGQINKLSGRMYQLHELGINDRKAFDLTIEYEQQREKLYILDGNLQALKKLIDHIDMQPVSMSLEPTIKEPGAKGDGSN